DTTLSGVWATHINVINLKHFWAADTVEADDFGHNEFLKIKGGHILALDVCAGLKGCAGYYARSATNCEMASFNVVEPLRISIPPPSKSIHPSLKPLII
ncbi:hypothetical protein, partial [Streptomyces brasiliscabiei]|uniref:hypothetical protein n=1 Tax=Streptomyces brasiliscabiei TaxID=2736302 RepID=UPI001C0F70E5